MPTSWRKLAVAGIAGIATTVAFAAPATACAKPEIKSSPSAQCLTDTTAKVTWLVSPGGDEEQEIVSATFTIDGAVKPGTAPTGDLKNDTPFTLTVPRTAAKAALTVKVKMKNTELTNEGTNEISLSTIDWTKCPKAVSPSPSGVASASSSAAALPVTGASTAIIAGVAVVLLAAGAGIFLVARRRRVRFTAA